MAEENKFKVIEAKWQRWWEEYPELYRAEDKSDKPKKYVLVEFPYPSGLGLHVGHAFAFTGGDVYARFKRMQGYNVLFPMGWDAFGLPTENYAIKMKRKPQEVTKENTDMFRSQMKKLAFSFDWSREVNTTDPQYYRWTQWIFIQLFKKGLAYKQEMPINWCPSCKIGLANEEVIDGKCERCGTEVSRRNISQWVVKITDYADRLLEGLKNTDFIEKVKAAQINWIGKSEGAKVKFKIKNLPPTPPLKKGGENSPFLKGEGGKAEGDFELEVFTTRPETLYGATFMVVAPEHPIVSELILQCSLQRRAGTPLASPSDDCALKINSETIEDIKNYVKVSRSKSDMERTELSKEKTGVFSGLYAINPVNNKEIPIWISDFVLASYGTGAIMSVPAHDERDEVFAKKYGLPIVEVVDKQGKMINSPNWNGLMPDKAIKKAIEWLKEKGIGEAKSSYHLRDWIFSRQHYWGEPIPMIFCKNCAKGGRGWLIQNPPVSPFEERGKIKNLPFIKGRSGEAERDLNVGWYPVPEEELPIKLPEVEAYEPTDDGQSPLSKIDSFVNCKCPVCGGDAKRETDTMPNWAGSDWYFLRYCDPHNDSNLAEIDILKKWMPVDVYVGGDEHNTLHLLYSRFIYQFLNDLGAVPKEIPEPYYHRMSHGVILGTDNNRMSKSKENVIVPETVADKYGVDVMRMYLMFMGPFDGTMAWNEKTLMGVKRFLDRFEKFVLSQIKEDSASKQDNTVLINKLIKEVGTDIENFGFNTAIAKQMKAINQLSIGNYELRIEEKQILVKLIAPLAPYTAEELWHRLGNEGSVHVEAWPEYEEKYLTEEKIRVAVEVNGKVRSEIEIDGQMRGDQQKILEIAKANKKIKQWIDGKEIVREIYVPGKVVNLVVK